MTKITWMHPSYRDLIIEELSKDRNLRRVFLNTANISDTKLAFSVAGGSDGTRSLPLLVDDESWDIISLRCSELATDLSARDFFLLIHSLRYVNENLNSPKVKKRVIKIIKDVCNKMLTKWNERKIYLSVLELRVFCEATLLINPLLPIPNLEPTWEYYTQLAKNSFAASNFEDWADLVYLISQNEPRFLRQIKFTENYLPFIQDLIDNIENEVIDDFEDLSVGELEDTGDIYYSFAESLRTLTMVVEPLSGKLFDLAFLLSGKEDEIREQVRDISDHEPDDEYEIIQAMQTDEFNIQTLFRDL